MKRLVQLWTLAPVLLLALGFAPLRAQDTDGDGFFDSAEDEIGTDKNDPLSRPFMEVYGNAVVNVHRSSSSDPTIAPPLVNAYRSGWSADGERGLADVISTPPVFLKACDADFELALDPFAPAPHIQSLGLFRLLCRTAARYRPLKMILRRLIPALIVAAALPAGGVTTVVDWLTPSPTDITHLLDDDGNLTAELSVNIVAGSMPGGFPASNLVSDAFWLASPPEFEDSLAGDASFPGLNFLVIPSFSTSTVQYRVTLEGALAGAVVVVGQLSATGPAQLTLSATGGPPLSLVGQHAWDAGLQSFDGTVDWDAGAGLLTPAPANTTDSGFAFSQAGNANRIDLLYTGSGASPLGDRIVIGIGVIPEPTSTALLLLAAPLLLRRRRSA